MAGTTSISEEAPHLLTTACDELVGHLDKIASDVDAISGAGGLEGAFGACPEAHKMEQKLRDHATNGSNGDGLKKSAEEQKKSIEGLRGVFKKGAEMMHGADGDSAHSLKKDDVGQGGDLKDGKGSGQGGGSKDGKGSGQGGGAGSGQGGGAGAGGGSGGGSGGGQGSGGGGGGGDMAGMASQAAQGAQQAGQAAAQGAQQAAQGIGQLPQQVAQMAQGMAGQGGGHGAGAASGHEAAAGSHGDHAGDHGKEVDTHGAKDVAEGLHEQHHDEKPHGDAVSGPDDAASDRGTLASASLPAESAPQAGATLPVAESAPATALPEGAHGMMISHGGTLADHATGTQFEPFGESTAVGSGSETPPAGTSSPAELGQSHPAAAPVEGSVSGAQFEALGEVSQ